jgi:hypothetical protein
MLLLLLLLLLLRRTSHRSSLPGSKVLTHRHD